MSQMGGLFELVLVFAIVLAFGFIELRSLRRDKKKAEERAKTDEAKI
jgi:hypothetical protein